MRALVLTIAVLGCGTTARTAEPPPPQERACAGFYDVVCADWLREHPVPPDRSRWMLYDEITRRNRARVKTILEGARKTPGDPLGDYFTACLDETRIAKADLAPMLNDLALIDHMARPEDIVATFARLAKSGVELPLEMWPAPDVDEPTRLIVEADVAGLGLPARDDYSRDDRLADYSAHIARVLRELGATKSIDERRARQVSLLERELALARLPERDRMDPRTLRHPVPHDRAGGST